MKVYLVAQAEFDDYNTVGIFDSLELAQAYMEAYPVVFGTPYIPIEVYELNVPGISKTIADSTG